MSVAGRDEGGNRGTTRVQQARCDGSGPRYDTFAGTAHLTCIKIISRAASIKNKRGRRTRMFALHDISVAFWHAQLPHEPIAMYPLRGEEEARHMWQMKRAMFGTRRASRLFQENINGVLGVAGSAALKVCIQSILLS